ncbi:unnamed protein product [Porites evermanni]|uniref:MAM domain-containing protein n=1 Tax=Porites evermanni TaxID=104178 RepID=A0ABN8ST20_9CNID|nr:unnamed protein product [Porites evermanni]
MKKEGLPTFSSSALRSPFLEFINIIKIAELERKTCLDSKMDDTKTMITVLFIIFPMLIKVQQALNLKEYYSNYINRKKNKINEKLERARKAVDEFVIEIEASCEEFTCNFDVSLCGFEQGTDDKFNWTRHKGNTPSSGTGPSFDHTTGDMTGYFVYIEASSPRKRGDNAKLYSPPLTFPGHMCLEFYYEGLNGTLYYHMSGAAIGSLKVTVNEKVVFSRSGDREDKWYKASINVSAIVGWHRVTFEGVRGDIAIDDFSLTAGSCAFSK